ncbi:serine/threonine-protein kinase [Desulfobacterales bacterium HSG17]|nr:serine/threonine-protein kinase [Desulfobacterales bacterium HSG17]
MDMYRKIIGNFQIISVISSNDMTTVYLAQHLTLQKKYAVKALRSRYIKNFEFYKYFENEAKAQSLLDQHPNIVYVHDFIKDDKIMLLVTENVEGETLDNIINKKGKMPENDAITVFKDILSGISYAHSKGVIHRNINSSNIFVDKFSHAKIMDFGISQIDKNPDIMREGITIGTPHYVSPEQITKPKEIDHRTDIYALGVVLYEMLSAQLPFDGDTNFEIYSA